MKETALRKQKTRSRCLPAWLRFSLCVACMATTTPLAAQQAGHKMIMDTEGMVMNFNSDELPQSCTTLAGDVEFDVRVGTGYAEPGMAYGFDRHEWEVEPCTRVTVTLINEDDVRHQWMVHGLPRYLYPQGMFHMEVNGGFQKTGTLIVPGGDSTFLVHCDVAQHMENGLKGQLVVGKGEGDLPSVPGISGPRHPDIYRPNTRLTAAFGLTLATIGGLLVALLGRSG